MGRRSQGQFNCFGVIWCRFFNCEPLEMFSFMLRKARSYLNWFGHTRQNPPFSESPKIRKQNNILKFGVLGWLVAWISGVSTSNLLNCFRSCWKRPEFIWSGLELHLVDIILFQNSEIREQNRFRIGWLAGCIETAVSTSNLLSCFRSCWERLELFSWIVLLELAQSPHSRNSRNEHQLPYTMPLSWRVAGTTSERSRCSANLNSAQKDVWKHSASPGVRGNCSMAVHMACTVGT